MSTTPLSADDLQILETVGIGATAEIKADGTLRPVGGLWEKLGAQTVDLAQRGLLHVVIVAAAQDDVPEEYLHAEATPLRVLKATNVVDAVQQLGEQASPRRAVLQYERQAGKDLDILGRLVPLKSIIKNYHFCMKSNVNSCWTIYIPQTLEKTLTLSCGRPTFCAGKKNSARN